MSTLFHNCYQWDAGMMRAIPSLNWYVQGTGDNPDGVTCIVAATEADALDCADRCGICVDRVEVRNNLESLMIKKYQEYQRWLKGASS